MSINPRNTRAGRRYGEAYVRYCYWRREVNKCLADYQPIAANYALTHMANAIESMVDIEHDAQLSERTNTTS